MAICQKEVTSKDDVAGDGVRTKEQSKLWVELNKTVRFL